MEFPLLDDTVKITPCEYWLCHVLMLLNA